MASTEIENFDPAATVDKINKAAANRALNRRNFLATLGMAGAAAGAGLMTGCNTTTSNVAVTTGTGIGQTNLLTFALNLQYLEATFYAFLTTGADLPASVTVGSGAVTGAPSQLAVSTTIPQQTIDLLNEAYYDELNHVTFLQNLLGSATVSRPAINLAAYGSITATNVLSIGRLLEDVGVTALANVITGLTTSNATYTAQLFATESFHSGALRLLSIQSSAPYINAGDGMDVPPADLLSATAEDGGPTGVGGFFASTGGAVAAANTTEGLAYSRTTSQVLAILYGGVGALATAGTAKGGFFPSGVNGSINTI